MRPLLLDVYIRTRSVMLRDERRGEEEEEEEEIMRDYGIRSVRGEKGEDEGSAKNIKISVNRRKQPRQKAR